MRKVAIIGGGGVRTPLLLYGIAQMQQDLRIAEVVLFDADQARACTMARIGQELVRQAGVMLPIRTSDSLEPAVDGAAFVLNSIRVGGMSARARDERIAIEHGFAGQETTGPGGAAMALRTVPVTLAHARIVQRVVPRAWFINFTNPAGLVTQALLHHTSLRVIGICDTPTELFHRIATVMGQPLADMSFDYAGLNHLGWIKRVVCRGKDVTSDLLNDRKHLRQLYSADLFDPILLQTLRLIPTEYLFFYYSQKRAHRNQTRAGDTRGGELEKMNAALFGQLASVSDADALKQYRAYLIRRNASYMKLEAEAGSAFNEGHSQEDPFAAATGYHRIALDLMAGLVSPTPRDVVVNVMNRGTITDLAPDDVVEVPCAIDHSGAYPKPVGQLPEAVRGLVQSVKAYERSLIRASVGNSQAEAKLALLEYPIVGQWEPSVQLLDALRDGDPEHLAYLR